MVRSIFRVMGAAFALVVGIIVGLCAVGMLDGCQLKHPVPCDPNAQWPDPCAYGVVETAADASADR